MRAVGDDPQAERLRDHQRRRESAERAAVDDAPTEDDAATHERRADKAAYLRRKLAERAEEAPDHPADQE